jgi:hypothetical protein
MVLVLMILCGQAWAENDIATAKGSFYLSASSGTYVGARDTTETSSAIGSAYQVVGQRKLGATYQLYRAGNRFVIPTMSSASECTLWVYGREDDSDTNFSIYIIGANSMRPIQDKADYILFDGRTAGGAHTGTILNNAYASTDFVDATWNPIVFNAAGIDSLVAAQGDTLWIALISKEDYDNSAPTNDEYIVFESLAEVGFEPYLSFTYNDPVVPVAKHDTYTLVNPYNQITRIK